MSGFKYEWINAIKGPLGPGSSATRLVLMMLSTYMNQEGKNCFPSVSTLAAETCLSERSVCTHLERAQQEGWIAKRIKGVNGKGWKRHEYVPLIPDKALKEVQHDNTEGTEPHDVKALKEVQSNKSINISKNTICGSKKAADPRIKVLIDWWCRTYEYKFGEKYAIPNRAKIGQQVKSILGTGLPFEDIQLKAMLFMADQDPFLVGTEEKAGAGYDIGIFLTRMNKYSANSERNNKHFTKHLVNEKGDPLQKQDEKTGE